jgi:cyclophilin family peptidyl-prolyl cis-trans isomerase
MHRTTGITILFSCVLLCSIAGCGENNQAAPEAKIQVDQEDVAGGGASGRNDPIELTADEALAVSPATANVPEVIVHTSQGDMRIKLFAEEAPQTVTNFLENYVDRDSYRDTIVHYVEKDYMMIAGGYTSEYEKIPARAAVVYEGDNGLRNRRGTIAINRHPDYIHSGTTEFFFNLVDNEFLDEGDALAGGVPESGANVSAPGYCVFGEIIEGIEVMDKIGAVEVKDRDGFPSTPAEPVIVISIERVR